MPPITSLGMTINAWLASVLALIIGNWFSPSVAKALLVLAGARARRIKHVAIGGADLYHRGIPLTEAQFRDVFAAYQAELDTLAPPSERGEWELAQQYAACQRLAVITGTHPHAFPNLGNADQAWEWYRDNNPYATGELRRSHRLRLSPPGGIAVE